MVHSPPPRADSPPPPAYHEVEGIPHHEPPQPDQLEGQAAPLPYPISAGAGSAPLQFAAPAPVYSAPLNAPPHYNPSPFPAPVSYQSHPAYPSAQPPAYGVPIHQSPAPAPLPGQIPLSHPLQSPPPFVQQMTYSSPSPQYFNTPQFPVGARVIYVRSPGQAISPEEYERMRVQSGYAPQPVQQRAGVAPQANSNRSAAASPYVPVKRGINHSAHFALFVFLCGMWLPCWVCACCTGEPSLNDSDEKS